jgi:hypothetical protein
LTRQLLAPSLGRFWGGGSGFFGDAVADAVGGVALAEVLDAAEGAGAAEGEDEASGASCLRTSGSLGGGPYTATGGESTSPLGGVATSTVAVAVVPGEASRTAGASADAQPVRPRPVETTSATSERPRGAAQ